MAVAKKDPFDLLMASAEKKYGLVVGAMGSITTDTQWISTGNIAIDTMLGGGIPMGRSVELFGPPGSGKTTLSLQTAINLQKLILAGGDSTRGIGPKDKILYLDYEQAMDPEYARKLGLLPKDESMMFTQPDTLEQGADFLLAAFNTGRFRLALVDSVAAMNPSAVAEAESVGKSLPAVQAKLMKPFGVTLNSVLKNNNGTVIFINHEMEKMEMGGARRPGMPAATTTPGGSALKFFASVRVQFRIMTQEKGEVMNPVLMEKEEVPIATDVRVKVVKNRCAPPFREAKVRVAFGKGFDNFWTAMQILLANKKVLYQSPRWFFHNVEDAGLAPDWMPRDKQGTNRPYINGKKNVLAAADARPEWRDAIIKLAEQVVKENIDILEMVVPDTGEVLDMGEEEDSDAIDLLIEADMEAKSTQKRAKL